MEKLSKSEVSHMLGISDGVLSSLSKKHLRYREDYFMHRSDGMRYTADAVSKLKLAMHPEDAVFDASPDEVLVATVCRAQPNNPRFVWVTVPGVDQRCTVQIPARLSKQYRKPGHRITVRKVQDGVYQYARVNPHHE